MSQRIKVMIRPKPLNHNCKSIMVVDYATNIVSVTKPHQKISNLASKDQVIMRSFAFSKIFSEEDTQEDIYEQAAFSLVENVIEGYNGTIFAYGQTASGKTYTIMGAKQYLQRKPRAKPTLIIQRNKINEQNQQRQYVNELKGIIPRAFAQIIAVTKSQKHKNHLIQCSFIQIYNQNVHDLLAEDVKSNLALKENSNKGLVIEGLKTFLVKSVQELQKYLKIGYKNRSVRQTSINKESSRSHCIFTIRIQQESTDQLGQAKFKVGKLNLVDLAGSERQSKTKIKEQGFKEATKINLSLSALGKVINCLSNSRQNQKVFIPYRDSKLTRILQDSLGGNTKTVMIGTVSQQSIDYEQTVSTLIYSSRARFIQNSPVLNEDPKDVLLRQYRLQIQKLKILLMQKQLQNQDLKEVTNKFSETNRVVDHSDQEAIKDKIQSLQRLMKKQGDNEEEIRYLQKIEHLKIKIKRQQERQQQMQKQQKKREQALLSIEKNYNNLNQEADVLRNKFSDLKNKYLVKCQELDDYHQQYEQERQQFKAILKSKNQQIKKLESLMETIIEHRNGNNQDSNDSEEKKSNSSHQKTKKMFSNFKMQSKIKINQPDINLFESTQLQRQTFNKKKYDHQIPKAVSYPKIMKPASVQGRGYQSVRDRKEEKGPKQSTQSSLKAVIDKREIEKQQQRREKIKQVDSLISLKRDVSPKLAFVTEVRKLKAEAKRESPSLNEIPSNLYFDIAQIKNEIIRQLKGRSKLND